MRFPTRAVVVIAIAGLLLGGCLGTGAEPVAEGTTEHVLDHDGRAREYRTYRPVNLPERAPLVVMLHGGFGSGAHAQRTYGWDAEADVAGFVVAYPDGVDRAWNTGGGCCGSAGADDVGFLMRMIDEIGRSVSLDPGRIFVTGMSNGAIMAYTMACRTPIVAAIGPVAGTQLGDCASPSPASVMHVHGTEDQSVRYDGAPGRGVARIDGPSVAEVNELWRAVDRCPPPSLTTDGPVTISTTDCPDGRAVALVTVAGAGHQWPGADPSRIVGDRPTDAFDATAAIWDFFAAHSR